MPSINTQAWPGLGMRRLLDSIWGTLEQFYWVFINYSIKLCITVRKYHPNKHRDVNICDNDAKSLQLESTV